MKRIDCSVCLLVAPIVRITSSPAVRICRAFLVRDALLAVCILEQLDFLLDRFGPDLLERGATAFQRGIFARGNQCAVKRGEGRLRGPGIGDRGLHRVDARITEFLEHGNEFIPCLRRIVGVETDLAEEILDHVGHAVLHETRAQVGLRIRRVVDVDANVGVLFLELLCRLLEPVRGLGLELEEIERDLPAAGTVAAARRAHADRQRAHRRADAAEHASHGRTSHPCCELHSDSLVHFHFPSPMAPLPRLTVASVWNRPFHSHHPACLETV